MIAAHALGVRGADPARPGADAQEPRLHRRVEGRRRVDAPDRLRRADAEHDQPHRRGLRARLLHRDPRRRGPRVPRTRRDSDKPSWGVALYWATVNSSVLQGEWWSFVFPGLAIGITVLSADAPARRHRRGQQSAPPRHSGAAVRASATRTEPEVTERRRADGGGLPRRPRRASRSSSSRQLVVDYGVGRAQRARGRRRRPHDPRRRDRRARGRVGLRQEHRRERDDADPPPAGAQSPAAASSSAATISSARSAKQLRRYRWQNVSMVFQSAMNALNPGDARRRPVRRHDARARASLEA